VKIDPPTKSGSISGVKPVSTGRARAKTTGKGQSAIRDDVHLTDQATLLGELGAHLADFDITDAALVEAVQAAIREGNFKVDEDKVAENLIKESVDLIHSQVKP
jgi:flagellar biosynthesis anti-sigma factor FlgM